MISRNFPPLPYPTLPVKEKWEFDQEKSEIDSKYLINNSRGSRDCTNI